MGSGGDYIVRHFTPIIIIEGVLLAACIAWVVMLTGITESNAVGNVIRSSLISASPAPAVALVISDGVFSFTLSVYFTRNELRFRSLLIADSSMILLSIPFLLYCNFTYSRQAIISGTAYTVYPYALQSAMPLLLGVFSLYIFGVFAFNARRNRPVQDPAA